MGALWQGLKQLIGTSLVLFYDQIPSYGVAIILLTVAVGVLLFPLTLKQTRSMRAMSELQPHVKRLQKEFKDDKEKLNQELMSLYKERGVNPAAGCLPLILQFPVWFALFEVLRSPLLYIGETSALAGAIQQNASFLGMDLKITPSSVFAQLGPLALAPYLLLILVVVASGYYQQKQATASSSGQEQSPQVRQMQAITKFMPVMFGVFSWTFPTGLVLYFAASNVFRIGQQALIFRLEPRGVPAEAPKPEPAAQEPERTPAKKRRKRRKKK
ncbi:MAG: YidC/Oxa1 family membrane protein insertase [Acidimicrobiia bacterium]